ncbi:MAG: hypothetical protein CBC29_06520 [Methylococcaceae bacterium TMED69]|nr:MAG: hypothetical protein CBC29_06520 [Methylococcaceae bacterium TMED69]|tara:strand:- start:80 stop:559 length:480 start_codon:yes stop_codon:yes gene_type:complete
MKITRSQLRKIIKESLLLEEPSDYYRDYRAGTITYAEYQQLVKDFENRNNSRSYSNVPSTPVAPRKKSQAMIDLETEPIWKGTPKELEKRVHKYLIDIGFYRDGGMGFVNPFIKGDHPDGGYTSNIPKVLRDGIASGDIDWATYPEMEPTYRKIDRSID